MEEAKVVTTPENKLEFLVLTDNRFTVIATQILREANKKFFRLFSRVADRKGRDSMQELVVWLAHTVLVYLTAMEHDKLEWNPVESFLTAFEQLLKIKQEEALKLKQELSEADEIDPAAAPTEATPTTVS